MYVPSLCRYNKYFSCEKILRHFSIESNLTTVNCINHFEKNVQCCKKMPTLLISFQFKFDNHDGAYFKLLHLQNACGIFITGKIL